MDKDKILSDAAERMEKAVGVVRSQLKGLRTGRATSGLVDSIRVDYHGSPTPLKQLAHIGVPDPQMIVIRPFDASVLAKIVKAIQSSDVGLAPNSHGRLIRLAVPHLSLRRRQQIGARVKVFAEEGRVAIRNIRRNANRYAEQAQKEKVLTEDQRDDTKDQIQEFTKKYERQINDLAAAKEKEVLED